MIYLYLFAGFIIVTIIIYFWYILTNNNENQKKNEKFVIIQKTGSNKKIYLNPPKNADKYGVVYSESKILCENNNCMIEDFENPPNPSALSPDTQNNDINTVIPIINQLVNDIDNLLIGIKTNVETYKNNYSNFKSELDAKIINKEDSVNSLKNILGFKFTNSSKESFGDINNKLIKSNMKIEKKYLPNMKGNIIISQ